jgi:hypothetical protein
MKTLLRVLGGIFVCVVLLLIVLSITGFEPHGLHPGLWLKGEVVTAPVTDWSFMNKVRTIKIQTRTWYLIPHSVTIGCIPYNGQLYLDSIYGEGGNYPRGRRWNNNVARDPHVRLKVGNKLYDCILARVNDPAEIAAVEEAKAKRSRGARAPEGSIVGAVYHVLSN